MNRKKAIITIGVLVALLPILGFPRGWESLFQVLAGLSLVLLSIWSSIDKKISLRAKAQKRQEVRKMMEESASLNQEDNKVLDEGLGSEETEQEEQEEPAEEVENQDEESETIEESKEEENSKEAENVEEVEEDKKEEEKPKAKKAKRKYTRKVTDLYPKTGQRGRRSTDINWNSIDNPLP